MGSRYVSDEDNAIALSWTRACYIKQFWGKAPDPPPTHYTALHRAYEYLVDSYDEHLEEIKTQIPLDRFTDPEVVVLSAIAWGYHSQGYKVGTDTVTWGVTSTRICEIASAIAPELPRREWKYITARILRTIEECGWMHRKRLPRGNLMEPGDARALWSLPVLPPSVRSTRSLYVPPLSLPPTPGTTGTPPLRAEGLCGTEVLPGGEWIDLRTEIVGRTTPGACWKYDNKRGRKAAVLWALRKAGIEVQDIRTGQTYNQHWTDPHTGEEVIIPRHYTDRWVRLPANMTIKQVIHLVEGKL